jgi:hypothetical protein
VHLIETFDAGRRLLGDALDVRLDPRIEVRVDREALGDRGEERELLFVRWMRDHGAVLFRLGAQMNEQRCVAAVVEDHVGRHRLRTIAPFKNAMRVLPIFRQRFALVSEDGRAALRDRRRCVILRGINVARRPSHFGAERLQSLDQHGGLNRHVQAAGDPRATQRRKRREFLANRHQSRHLGFCNGDFLAAPVGEFEIRDVEVGEMGLVSHSVHQSLHSD